MPEGNEGNWQSEHSFFDDNPDAVKATEKYKTIDDYHKGAIEAMKKVGRPYWLPDDHSKLSDEQKADIRANVAKMNGVPETADGYVIEIPAETKVPIDYEAIAKFKMFGHEKGLPPNVVQDFVDMMISHEEGLESLREQARQERAREGFKSLSKRLGGDVKAMAAMQQIMEYLQKCCVGEDGKPDADMWEQFKVRMFFEDKIVDDVLSSALLEPARLASEGGAPGGDQRGLVAEGAFDYSEMDKK